MKRWMEQILSIPLCLTIIILPFWLTHLEMVKEDSDCKALKRATFTELKKLMLSVDWIFNPMYPSSLFTKGWQTEVHADIYKFENVGYLLTPYAYLRAKILQRKIRKTLPGFEKYSKPYIQ
jgi:hypothetical protein